ncbi:MAG: hypothetical protein AB1762_23140 [Gemmatimonadota bacterium]
MLLIAQVSSGVAAWAAVSQIIVGFLVALLLVGVIFVLLTLRKAVQQLTSLVNRTAGDVSGIARDAKTILDDVRVTVSVARREIEHVGTVVHKGAERADHVLALAHRRVRRVDRLLEDTQNQVRDLAESAASTVRHLGSAAYLARALLTPGKKRRARKRAQAAREAEQREREIEEVEDSGA